ncbi:MAG TPA: helix-turn-helix domain-containing protein [Chthoniobacter sp.]|nr:helix-turn-helix domain-containing protein [Chthoniobacter sp.]
MNTPAAVQTDFDFLVPTQKGLLHVDEVAEILRVDRSTIYLLEASGELEVHRRNIEKSHRKITRRSVVAHLASTATYDTADLVKTIADLAQTLTRERRIKLAHQLLQS